MLGIWRQLPSREILAQSCSHFEDLAGAGGSTSKLLAGGLASYHGDLSLSVLTTCQLALSRRCDLGGNQEEAAVLFMTQSRSY